jgi:tetratricopeptide (TPR) repeat protein
MGLQMDAHELNARLLRFRSQPQREDPHALARDLMTAERYGDARGVVVSALGDEASDSGLLVLEGRAWLMEGDLVQAQAALVRAAKAGADNAEAYRWLGEVLLARGDAPRAKRALERSLSLNPDDSEAQGLLDRATDEPDAPTAVQGAARESVASTTSERVSATGTLPPPPVTPVPEAPTSALPSLRSSSLPAQSFAPTGGTLPPPPVTPVPAAPAAGGSVLPPRPSPPHVETLPPPPVTPVPAAPASAYTSSAGRVAASDSLPPPPRVPQGAPSIEEAVGLGGAEPPLGAEERTRRVSYEGLERVPPSEVRRSSAPPPERPSSVPPPPVRQSSVPPPPERPSSAPPPPVRQSSVPPPPAERRSSLPPPARASSVPPPPAARQSSMPPPPSARAPRGDATIDLERSSLGSLASAGAASALSWSERMRSSAGALLRGRAKPVSDSVIVSKTSGWTLTRATIAAGVALVVIVGGWWGLEQWAAHQQVVAGKLVQRAQIALHSGDATALRNAEAFLQDARERDPDSRAAAQAQIFLEAETLLAGVAADPSALSAALERGTRFGVEAPWLALAKALVEQHGRDPQEANAILDPLFDTVKGDAALSYLVGRAGLLHGHPQSKALLESALEIEPGLHAARVALAGSLLVAGQRAQAVAQLEPALSGGDEHVRARLWMLFAKGKATPHQESRARLDAVKSLAQSGAPIDRALWSLGHARVLRAEGDRSAAAAALAEALKATRREPAVAALTAREALDAGERSLAEEAAKQAIAAAPTVAHRVLLARVHLSRQDGAGALAALKGIAADDPALILLRARAALQGEAKEPWAKSLEQLSALEDLEGDLALEKTALELALQARVEPRWALWRQARRLARRAADEPDAQRALGEVALALRKTDAAIEAFAAFVQVAPQDAEAYMLLGRARYLAGDFEGAQAAFARAIELVPGYVGALSGMSALLLDAGRYDEVAAVHAQLLKQPAGARAGKLGRIAELLGTGKLDDAHKQYEALDEGVRDTLDGHMVGARVALARGRPKDAIKLLKPLAESGDAPPVLLALYGDALYAADQVNASAVWYTRAIKADGKLPEALIGRAEVHLRAERPYDAMPLLERAEKSLQTILRPATLHARMQTLMGRGYCERGRRGDRDLAVEVLNRAIAHPNPPPEAYFWLGEALGGRDTPPASIAFRRYVELAPEGRYAERARRALGPLL